MESLLFLDISVLKVQLAQAAKSNERNNDKEEEELHLFFVYCQIKKAPYTQSAARDRCYGQGVLLPETQTFIIKRRCSKAARAVMEVLTSMPLYIYTANLSAKALSLPNPHDSRIGNPHSPERHTQKD